MTEEEAKNYIYGSIEAYGNIWCQWSPIFTQTEKYPRWLRRNAISIWVRGMVDYLQKREHRADATNVLSFDDSIIDLIELFDNTSISILGDINRDLQIMLWFIRNQCLHGHLSLFYHDNLGIQLYDKDAGCLVKETISRQELSRAIDSANQAEIPLSESLLDNEEYRFFIENIDYLISEESRDEYHKNIFGKEILRG